MSSVVVPIHLILQPNHAAIAPLNVLSARCLSLLHYLFLLSSDRAWLLCRTAFFPSMDIALDATQRQAVQLFEEGFNVAILGRAGSGKSVLLLDLIARAREKWGDWAVAVVALSGSAAVGVNGQTIHSLCGWDVRPLSRQRWLAETTKRQDICLRMNRLRVLFVDEVATMPASLFARLALIMRRVAAPELQGVPFGACQIVCTFIFR